MMMVDDKVGFDVAPSFKPLSDSVLMVSTRRKQAKKAPALFPTHGRPRVPKGFAMLFNVARRAAETGHCPKTLARAALKAAGAMR